jgi:GntR family transcriptional regulator
VILRIDPSSPVPPFEQIRAQVTTMAAAGVLAPGLRLPTIRQLSKDLGLAGGTVARAYRELENDGVIATRGRHGSFVAEVNAAKRGQVPDRALKDAAQEFAIRARQLGVEQKRAIELAREAFGALEA